MTKAQAEALIAAHVKPIFGFALKRCASIQDAEDVAQEIALRAYRALLHRGNVGDPVRYLWTVAHNVLANHYRDRSRMQIGLPDSCPAETDFESVLLREEAALWLHREIAALGRMQREIVVAYYFHGQKQTEIADCMNLPLGTVKWHLFEAKKELKKSMEQNRPLSHLQFDPIAFTAFGTEGSIGDEGSPWRIFRSRLNQNIAWATWREARTIREISDCLGVSPVYIEDAVDFLAGQGYLTESRGRYRCALLLTEITAPLNDLSARMYEEAAALIAPALHRALSESDLWSAPEFYPGAKPTSGLFSTARTDRDFALWALIPWCIANSLAEKAIPFREAATLRPDGARNIVHATIAAPGVNPPPLYDLMDGHFSGPCWNESDGLTLWQLDTCWSEKRIGEVYQQEAQSAMALLRRFLDGETLSAEEYAVLAQKGLIRTQGDPEGSFAAGLAIVWLKGRGIRDKVLDVVRGVYAAHQEALDSLRRPYAEALLADTPEPLRPLRRYMLQNVYQSDWFIMHCLHRLMDAGLLPPPEEHDRRALHTLLLSK